MPAPPNSSQQGSLKQRTGEGGSSSSTSQSQNQSQGQSQSQGQNQSQNKTTTTTTKDTSRVPQTNTPQVISEVRGKLGSSSVSKQPDQKFQDRVPQAPRKIDAMQGGLGMTAFGKSTMTAQNVARNSGIPRLTGNTPSLGKVYTDRVPQSGLPDLPPAIPSANPRPDVAGGQAFVKSSLNYSPPGVKDPARVPSIDNDNFLQPAMEAQDRRRQMEAAMQAPIGGISPMAGQGQPGFNQYSNTNGADPMDARREFDQFASANYGMPDPSIPSGPETMPDPPDSWMGSLKEKAGDFLQQAKTAGQEIYDSGATPEVIKGYATGGPLGAAMGYIGGLFGGTGGNLPAWQTSGDERGDRGNPFLFPKRRGTGYDNGLAYMNQLLRKYFNG